MCFKNGSPAVAPYCCVPVNVPEALCTGSIHVPLKTAGVLEVSKFPVHVAVPAVPLYVVPEVRLPDTASVPLGIVAVPETLPLLEIVAFQVPETLPL